MNIQVCDKAYDTFCELEKMVKPRLIGIGKEVRLIDIYDKFDELNDLLANMCTFNFEEKSK